MTVCHLIFCKVSIAKKTLSAGMKICSAPNYIATRAAKTRASKKIPEWAPWNEDMKPI